MLTTPDGSAVAIGDATHAGRVHHLHIRAAPRHSPGLILRYAADKLAFVCRYIRRTVLDPACGSVIPGDSTESVAVCRLHSNGAVADRRLIAYRYS